MFFFNFRSLRTGLALNKNGASLEIWRELIYSEKWKSANGRISWWTGTGECTHKYGFVRTGGLYRLYTNLEHSSNHPLHSDTRVENTHKGSNQQFNILNFDNFYLIKQKQLSELNSLDTYTFILFFFFMCIKCNNNCINKCTFPFLTENNGCTLIILIIIINWIKLDYYMKVCMYVCM